MNKHPYIAITGGIGSGKSYICKVLSEKGIDVYDCDAAAKRLMATDKELQEKLSEAVGKNIFREGKLQKSVLAKFLLASEHNKQAINNIVHPAVAKDFTGSEYQWLESAILFESQFDKRVDFDYIVCVAAPEDVRMQRIMKRDNICKEKALQWIRSQMSQEEMVRKANFTIYNDGNTDIKQAVNIMLTAIYGMQSGQTPHRLPL